MKVENAERRETLTRQRVLEAAVELADRHGIEAVSMRRLGQELGVEAMSLYTHVRSKDDLLDGMVEVVMSQIPAVDSRGGWKPALRKAILGARGVLLRHPWTTDVIETRAAPGPAMLRVRPDVMRVLEAWRTTDKAISGRADLMTLPALTDMRASRVAAGFEAVELGGDVRAARLGGAGRRLRRAVAAGLLGLDLQLGLLEVALDRLPASGLPLLRATLLIELVRLHDRAGNRAAAQKVFQMGAEAHQRNRHGQRHDVRPVHPDRPAGRLRPGGHPARSGDTDWCGRRPRPSLAPGPRSA